MIAANNRLSQAQKDHFSLTTRLAQAHEDVHSCDREKQARQAQMERIAGQNTAAITSHAEVDADWTVMVLAELTNTRIEPASRRAASSCIG
jgi:hypothetical protein